MKFRCLLFLSVLLLAVGCARKSQVAEAVCGMKEQYPLATLQDVYKTFYQDRFGAEHMITDTASVRAYLTSELETSAADSVPNPYYEPTGAKGRFVRVYLRCVNEGLITADLLFDAFIRSAHPETASANSWAEEWKDIVAAVEQAGVFTDIKEDSEQLCEAARINHAVRHSDAYRNTYHPHYRIVAREIFEKEIKPLIVKQL